MKLLIISDAWRPQINGVVRTYESLIPELEAAGHVVKLISPNNFPLRIPMPGYKEIELAIFPYHRLKQMIQKFSPDSILIATEGPLGYAARRFCHKKKIPFNSSFHTNYPDYAAKRIEKLIPSLHDRIKLMTVWIMREFHCTSTNVMVATPSLEKQLNAWGFNAPMRRLTLGVSTEIFNPDGPKALQDIPRPIALYVGRIAIEKNIESFLSMPWQGSKVIVGDGPALKDLKKKFLNAYFVGTKIGHELAAHYRAADVFIFPSKTDTFGMVIIEALACGTPVAAYDVMGPKDIITEPVLGVLNTNLANAANSALNIQGSREERYCYVKKNYTWKIAAQQLIEAAKISQNPAQYTS